MLTNREKAVMQYIYEMGISKGTCLLSPNDINHALLPKYDLTNVEIEEIIQALVLENYITMVYTEKKGKMVYCITLNPKGNSFQRENVNQRKKIWLRILQTVLLAILSFIVGVILKAIFY